MMLKNITMSAEASLIERARQRAAQENTTLNEEFRRWLEQYVDRPKNSAEYFALMDRLTYVKPGRKFTREEMNER
jgi:hypothetical protein